jgi:hypothetical protein
MEFAKQARISKLLFISGLIAGPAVFGFHSLIRYTNVEHKLDYLEYITFPILLAGGIACIIAPSLSDETLPKKIGTSILGVVLAGIVWGGVYGVCAALFGYPLMSPPIR